MEEQTESKRRLRTRNGSDAEDSDSSTGAAAKAGPHRTTGAIFDFIVPIYIPFFFLASAHLSIFPLWTVILENIDASPSEVGLVFSIGTLANVMAMVSKHATKGGK